MYEYALSSIDKTGFVVASCRDPNTGLIVRTPLASPTRSFPGFEAYVGAKFSRSREGMIDIMEEIESGYREGILTPEKRLGSIVHGLKHQSPGGMAHVAIAIENVPIITAASLFRRTVLHDGQEASTRYIDFASGNDLPELSTLLPAEVDLPDNIISEYKELQEMSLGLYLGWFQKVYDAYKKHFEIDDKDKKQKDALTARTYDTVRGFLLSGFKTSMIYVTNATTMQQMLSDFGAGRLSSEKNLAETALALLAPAAEIDGYSPEIKSLLNHTEPNFRTRDEQIELMRFFENQPGYKELLKKRRNFNGLSENRCQLVPEYIQTADRIIAQEIIVINPALKLTDVFDYVKGLDNNQKWEIGRIIFSRRDRFNLPAIAASGGPLSLHFQIDLGIERDLGRHRAWERVSPIHETYDGFDEIANSGFTQAAYLRQIPEMRSISLQMEKDMLDYYQQRENFLFRLKAITGNELANKAGMYLLPLAHQVDMVMNSDIRNMVHFEDIRIREGAHIDARLVVASANEQVADSDALYESLKYPTNRVLVDDRNQFISRN